MQQDLLLEVKGLHTTADSLSEAPKGSLKTAKNVVIDKKGLIEPRRGFEQIDGTLAASANQLFVYKDTLLAHQGASTISKHDGSSWSNYTGTFAPVDSSVKVRGATAKQNQYFCTAQGIQKLDSLGGTIVDAGVPQGLDGSATLSSAGSGAFTKGNQFAYRIVWGYKDANDNLILGAPSQRIIITNPAGGTDDTVALDFSVPQEVTTSWFYQVYRSRLSGSEGTEPDDELGLVYENNPTSGQITAKTITVTDETADDLIGATIYTAASQETIVAANNTPPIATDLAEFKGYLFGCNSKSKYRLYIDLLAIGGAGLALDDTITLTNGVYSYTYTAKAAYNVSSGHFALASSGTPASKITDTALSLVKLINRSTGNTNLYAYYLSGVDDLPGKILIEERDIGGTQFTATSSRGAAWSPNLTSAESSTNDANLNGLWYSKFQEPEAVPLTNMIKVGSADAKILRIISLRGSLFIFKEDGVFTLTGDSENDFSVNLLDNTVLLLNAETAQRLQNQIYCLTDQGVVSVTESGVELISRPIEADLQEIYGRALTQIRSQAFAVAYESDRKYILFLPQLSDHTAPQIAYVYNYITNNWTTFDLQKTSGIANETDGKLYLSDSTGNYVSKERKAYNFSDHADEQITVTVTNVSTNILTLSTVTNISVGDLFWQSTTKFSKITAIDTSAATITLEQDLSFTTGSHKVLASFDVDVEWNPITAGAPSLMKQFSEAVLLTNRNVSDAYLGFSTDLAKAETKIQFTGNSVGAWGLFSWGASDWGGVVLPKNYRTYVPREKQRASLLNIRLTENATYNNFEIAGLRISYRMFSQRSTR